MMLLYHSIKSLKIVSELYHHFLLIHGPSHIGNSVRKMGSDLTKFERKVGNALLPKLLSSIPPPQYTNGMPSYLKYMVILESTCTSHVIPIGE